MRSTFSWGSTYMALYQTMLNFGLTNICTIGYLYLLVVSVYHWLPLLVDRVRTVAGSLSFFFNCYILRNVEKVFFFNGEWALSVTCSLLFNLKGIAQINNAGLINCFCGIFAICWLGRWLVGCFLVVFFFV